MRGLNNLWDVLNAREIQRKEGRTLEKITSLDGLELADGQISAMDDGLGIRQEAAKNPHAQALGKLGGASKSAAKQKASRKNGKKGGRKPAAGAR